MNPAGEREQFVALYGSHGAAVLAYARRRVGADEAEDVLAETFLVAWRRRREVPGDALPWLYAVAGNVVRNRLRAERRRGALQTRMVSVAASVTVEEADPDPNRDGGFEAAYADGVVTTREDGKPASSTRLDDAARRATEDIDNNTGLTQPGRDPLPVIGRLLAEGKLEPAGTTELDGRKVQRLAGSEPAPDAMTPGVEVEYLVDASTYLPLRLSTTATLQDGRPAGSSKRTFLEYERLPLTPANARLLVVE